MKLFHHLKDILHSEMGICSERFLWKVKMIFLWPQKKPTIKRTEWKDLFYSIALNGLRYWAHLNFLLLNLHVFSGCVRLSRDRMWCIHFRMRMIIMEKAAVHIHSGCSAFEPLNITIHPSHAMYTHRIHLYKLKFIASLETYTRQ